ncbi:MAG: methyltransferase domain-containing protein [Bacteroidota bacterium]|jgi:predicted TPR repeat methyltransferase
MPIGSFSTFRDVVRLVLMNNPTSVLDLGIGHGINGAGIRNWLDNGVNYNTQLEGVEGFNYRSPLWDCYDKVHECTIHEFFEKDNRKWDCILMTDVIEHFTKDEGVEVITRAKERLNEKGLFVIVTPGVWIEQGAAYGNELETHRSLWSAFDFTAHGFQVVKDGSEDDMGYKMVVVEYIKN